MKGQKVTKIGELQVGRVMEVYKDGTVLVRWNSHDYAKEMVQDLIVKR